MRTTMLKRRLNPFLLATTILVLSILAALSVLWQSNLSDIQNEKNNLSETLEMKNETIQELRSENSNLTQEISVLEGNVQTYVDENEFLRSRIDSLNSTVENLEEEKEELSERNEELIERNEDLSGINDTLEVICSLENNTVEDGDENCNQYGHEYRGN